MGCDRGRSVPLTLKLQEPKYDSHVWGCFGKGDGLQSPRTLKHDLQDMAGCRESLSSRINSCLKI